jgi:hypothetical protein
LFASIQPQNIGKKVLSLNSFQTLISQGVATKLVQKALEVRRSILGASPVYLFTPDQEKLYLSIGFNTIEKRPYAGHEEVIKVTSLSLDDFQNRSS